MPNFAGTSSGVNSMLRKVAGAAASNPQVEIRQDGEQFYIKTSTSVRTTEINLRICGCVRNSLLGLKSFRENLSSCRRSFFSSSSSTSSPT